MLLLSYPRFENFFGILKRCNSRVSIGGLTDPKAYILYLHGMGDFSVKSLLVQCGEGFLTVAQNRLISQACDDEKHIGITGKAHEVRSGIGYQINFDKKLDQ